MYPPGFVTTVWVCVGALPIFWYLRIIVGT